MTDSTPPTPSPSKRTHRKPWYQTERVVNAAALAFGPLLRDILTKGVSSLSDLHTKVEKAAKCSVPLPVFKAWLEALGYDSLFGRRNVIRLPDAPPPRPQTLRVPDSAKDEEGDDDLDTRLPPAMRGMAAPPASAASSGADASGETSATGAEWVPPPNPFEPALVGGRPAHVLP